MKREKDEKARGTRERRETPRERETCTLRCTRERTRETRGSKEREPRTRARERESTRTRECDVAGCASYIEALEGARRSEEAE